MPTVAEIKAAIEDLVTEAPEVIKRLQKAEETLKFGELYQRWYTRALKVVDVLAPDRAAEFRTYYEIDTKRKELTYANYAIQDYIKLIAARKNSYGKELWEPKTVAALRFMNQLHILKSLSARVDSVLADVRGRLFADIQDAELHAARDLMRINVRAAGALTRVVLERHLQQVVSNHGIVVKKKDPTVADLNDPIRSAGVYDLPTWRKIQYLADLGNLCSHQKGIDPTKQQVDELIQGVNWVVKNIL